MNLTQRRICECLQANPGRVSSEVAKTLRMTVQETERSVQQLIEAGYLKHGRRLKKGKTLRLTGKAFPPSYELIAPKLRREQAISAGFNALIPAMRAMVDVRREGV
ncbi:winged helix-turn-helix domain-containing protein [Burkholderia sp. Nafp2/4-1b]|uniref:winged helix-turn-helix domain-containing protein n=1 Tax=Burkholderia sp. Nafp2/4-1b TaxID=2116686 RepID=UPI0013CEE0B3|nr:winged helix-turn-helix domain-containing protein [Burkholderia sp. Nafp2/4-1b]